MSYVIYQPQLEIAEFVQRLVPVWPSGHGPSDYSAIGFTDGKDLICGVVFTHFTGIDCHISIGAVSPLWATRRNFVHIFECPFVHWGCARLTAVISKKNYRSRKLCEGTGFKLEGNKRKAFQDGTDALIYGMLKEECKWLQNRRAPGKD